MALRPARTVTALLWPLVKGGLSLAFSTVLHLVLATPLLLLWWLNASPPEETPGDEGTEEGQAGNDGGEVPLGEPEPVQISMYVEAPVQTAVVAEVVAGPAPGPAPSAKPATPNAKGASDGDTTATQSTAAARMGVQGRRPRGERKPCEPIDEITSIGEDKWRVERDVVDYYAVHLKELEKQVGVATHYGADGRPDGARVFLPRCSVLRQAGIRHGDIVNTINGRRVATLADAVGAYFFLRNEENLRVELTRKNGDTYTFRYRMKR